MDTVAVQYLIAAERDKRMKDMEERLQTRKQSSMRHIPGRFAESDAGTLGVVEEEPAPMGDNA